MDAKDLEELTKEIEDCDRRIAENPNDHRAYFARGAAKSDLGLYDAAVKDFSRAININPAFAEAYLNRSCCYDELGKETLSEKDLDRYERLKASSE